MKPFVICATIVLATSVTSTRVNAESDLFALLEARKIAHNLALASFCDMEVAPSYSQVADRKIRAGMGDSWKDEISAIALQKQGDWESWSKSKRKQHCNVLRSSGVAR